jgi:hypothetical protein
MKQVCVIGRYLAMAVCILSNALTTQAGIVTFDLSSQPGNQPSTSPTVAQNVFATALVRGPGLGAALGAGSMNANGFTTLPNIDLSDYFQFTLSGAEGYALNVTQIAFGERRSASGVGAFTVRTSLDAFQSFNFERTISLPDDANLRNHIIDLDGITNFQGTVDVRIYGFSSESASGTWRLMNHSEQGGIVLTGTVTAVPEPSSLVLLGAMTGTGLLFRRRITKKRSRPHNS